jgi:hypothetical protein
MTHAYATLWNQFILAAALARRVRPIAAAAGDDLVDFSYTDTHAGPGRLPGPLPGFDGISAEQSQFLNRAMFQAYEMDPPLTDHLGSWLLAGRVISGTGGAQIAMELDVNDLSPPIMEQAMSNREGGWVRLWSHDWFLFLRSCLSRPSLPDFVFIDPPADDRRGPAYAIDAAILLDTMAVPYMVTYPQAGSQDAIDQIGRTGLELLDAHGQGCGALLGGGAETVLLDIMSDLRLMAQLLGCTFHARLPQVVDYVI